MSLLVSLLKQRDYIGAQAFIRTNPNEVILTESIDSSSHNWDILKQGDSDSVISGNIPNNEDPVIFYALGSVETLEQLLLIHPQFAWVQNSQGDRPIHVACQMPNIDTEIFRILLFAFPEGASTKNKLGKLPLHFAVANPCIDIAILEILYHAFPNALFEKESKNHSLPLHYACAFKAPLATVQFCIEKYYPAIQQKNRQFNLPLHLALMYDAPETVQRFLIDKYPEAVKELDARGRLPLHIALQSQMTSLAVIHALILHFPASVTVAITSDDPSDKNWFHNKKPIHIAIRFSRQADVIRCLLNHSSYKEILKTDQRIKIKGSGQMAAGDTTVDDIQSSGGANECSIMASSSASNDPAPFVLSGDTILHTAIEYDASIDVLEAIIELRPSALKEMNFDDKLPIHYAAWRQVGADTMVLLIRNYPESLLIVNEKTGNSVLHFALQYFKRQQNHDTHMIEKVLSYNAAASFLVNKAGYYPIHLAAKSACPYRVFELMLKLVPFSFGFFSQNQSRFLPLDIAIASGADADVIGLLLGYTEKSTLLYPKRVLEDRRMSSEALKSEPITGPDRPALNDSSISAEHSETAVSLLDAHLHLQQQYTEQGEEIRKLRARMHALTTELQARNSDILGYKKDISWSKDRIRILEREVAALTIDLDSYK